MAKVLATRLRGHCGRHGLWPETQWGCRRYRPTMGPTCILRTALELLAWAKALGTRGGPGEGRSAGNG
eukprot:9490956-Pyramimonas_sp.AAC.1